jgi:hypothetical protein
MNCKEINPMFARSLSKVAVTLTLLAVVAFVQAPMNAQGSRYSLSIHNTSGYHIYNIYMSSSESNTWIDQLGSGVLMSGDTFTISDIPPGEYDLKFVDKDGDACKLLKVNVFHNTSWNLSSQWLLGCEFGH